MTIRTESYEVDYAEFRKVMVATCYRRLWWFLAIFIAMATGLLIWGLSRGDTSTALIGGFEIVTLAALPYFIAYRAIETIRKSRLAKVPVTLEFDETECRIFSNDELRTRLKLNEMQRVNEVEQGIQLWTTKGQFVFFPRRAFRSPSDFDTAYQLVRTGLQVQPR